jgi:DHA2 family multidrug resistance protein
MPCSTNPTAVSAAALPLEQRTLRRASESPVHRHQKVIPFRANAAPTRTLGSQSGDTNCASTASGLSNMLRNLGGAVGAATLATVLTKREQCHSNIIGQSVTLYRDEVRQRIADLTHYFLSHGISDPAAAQHQAIAAVGNIVKRQALIIGFSDTFAIVGIVLAIAAIALARKSKPGAAAGAH